MRYQEAEQKVASTKAFLLRLLVEFTEPEFAELRDRIRRFLAELGD